MGGGNGKLSISTLISSGLLKSQCYLQSLHVILIRKGQHSCRVHHQNPLMERQQELKQKDLMGEQNARWANQNQSYCQLFVMNGYILTTSLPLTPRIQLHGHKWDLSSNVGSPNSFLCVLSMYPLPRQHQSPQEIGEGQGLACSCALWPVEVPTVFSKHSLDQWGQESGGGYWPQVCPCSKATFKKVEPVEKKTWLLGFN